MIVRTLIAFAATVALIAVLIWPWPVPEVDWRAAVERALAADDCKTASTIVHAATDAGIAEADEMANDLHRDRCPDQAHVGGTYYPFVDLYRPGQQSTEDIYGLTDSALRFPRHQFVSAALFLCVAPYNGVRTHDYAALSKVVPDDDGPLLAFHRLRRDTCLGVLQNVTEGLVDADDARANDVAYRLLMFPPFPETTESGFLIARLLLVKGFVASTMTRDAKSASLMRSHAWDRLKLAADAGHVPALHVIVKLLHEGRYHARDDKEAYFWIVRLRHLGHDPGPLAKQIEANLSLEDREYEERREVEDREGPIELSPDDGERS